ncbi:MAG: DNA primase [Acutalibacteraceae bacterium]
MAISEEFLNEIRLRIDIDELIGQYVDLKKHGRLSKALCPFHSEKTPSFTVYSDTQSYYCFGCQKGGDAITFIREIENLDYIEAVRMLCEKAGLNMPEDNYDDTINKKRRRMLEINKEAARFFHNYMLSPKGKKGLDYFLSRGLSMNTIRRFGLGYAPDDWSELIKYMTSKGYSKSELHEADLAKKSTKNDRINYFDNFRDRAIVPIIDLRGNIIAFGGRVLDGSGPKYVNTSDTLVYKKSQAVFALNFAKNGNVGKLILAEGYMDVISLHQAGFTNAVAGLGTALTDEQVRLISRYCEEIILAYDSDEAGKKAVNKAIYKFERTGVKIRVLELKDGKDPDEIIKKYGPERFKALVDGAANDIEYKLLEKRALYDLATSDGKMNFLNDATFILAKLNSPIEREIYASRLASELDVSKEAILTQAQKNKDRKEKRENKVDFGKLKDEIAPKKDEVNPQRPDNIKAAKAEETLISSIIANPDFLKKLENKISSQDFVTDFNRRVYEKISQRILDGLPIDNLFLSAYFTPEEMGRIVKLSNNSQKISNTITECDDCIKVLKQEKNRVKNIDPKSLSDEEFLKLFNKNT